MTLSAATAIANVEAATSNPVDSCAEFVWQMFGSPSTIAHFDSAADLWARSTVKYGTWDETPVGAVVYLGALSGPRYPGDVTYAAGDVFIKTDANGGHPSDAKGNGIPGYMTLAERETQTGRTFAGGMGDLEGDLIDFAGITPAAPIHAPAPTTWENDMPFLIHDTESATAGRTGVVGSAVYWFTESFTGGAISAADGLAIVKRALAGAATPATPSNYNPAELAVLEYVWGKIYPAPAAVSVSGVNLDPAQLATALAPDLAPLLAQHLTVSLGAK